MMEHEAAHKIQTLKINRLVITGVLCNFKADLTCSLDEFFMQSVGQQWFCQTP